jgi:hypothetical protein
MFKHVRTCVHTHHSVRPLHVVVVVVVVSVSISISISISIYLEELGRTVKILSQDNQCPGWDLNWDPALCKPCFSG